MEAKKQARIYWITTSQKYALECTMLKQTRNPAVKGEIDFRRELIREITRHVDGTLN